MEKDDPQVPVLLPRKMWDLLAAVLRVAADQNDLDMDDRIIAEALCLDIEVQAGIRVMPTNPEDLTP